MTGTTSPRLVLVESNTTGSGREFCARARALGVEPLLLTRDPRRYAYVEQDAIPHLVTDTADRESVAALCRGLGGSVAGVTSSSEYFVATAAAAARSLGLPAPDPEAVDRCRDKALQRRILAAAGVPGPLSREVRSTAEGAALARVAGGTVVVKPVLGSGSDGVRACSGPAETAEALRPLLDAEPGRALVEEYLDGPEFSVETFDERVVGVTAKRLGSPPRFLETGHEHPADLAPGAERALAETALAALRALGLGWGPAHVEIRLTTAGPRIVEVNPRLAGGMIPALVEAATGVDLVAATVARVLGAPVPLEPTRSEAAAIRFLFAGQAGTVALVSTDGAERSPGVVRAAVTVREGARVEVTHSFRDRIGHVIAVAPRPARAVAEAEHALGLLGVLVSRDDDAALPAD
ncbi:ATP-grasp domain-containing protein [Nocardiopsis lambiniae]|uniref:ATP-grasp domain-containing protein n=1 Tax=Nocardiopsis lambiniae TaxID=3075539 RepID=A0ABU2M609_9ACTN|nr:ATP-grasp domain-containing protein [Nocardiopsis sp. DSM 44743]MDT0328082.1 ATP-grasp domain-containing protein [Nocardiopsis sp. DSM 44743]